MTNNKTIRLLFSGFIFITLAGCSHQARSDYHEAGSEAAKALQDTGKAVGEDTKALGHSISDASDRNGDSQTAERVRQAILSAPDVQTSDLKVEINDRTAKLRGTVQTEIQNQKAEQIARHLLGSVYSVDDQLKVPEAN